MGAKPPKGGSLPLYSPSHRTQVNMPRNVLSLCLCHTQIKSPKRSLWDTVLIGNGQNTKARPMMSAHLVCNSEHLNIKAGNLFRVWSSFSIKEYFFQPSSLPKVESATELPQITLQRAVWLSDGRNGSWNIEWVVPSSWTRILTHLISKHRVILESSAHVYLLWFIMSYSG